MSPDDIAVVTPIGLVGGGGTEIIGRSYVFPRSDSEGPIPLFAPTAMTLLGGAHYIPPGAPDGYVPDWSLAFRADCSSGVIIELYHVKDVAPAIAMAVGENIAPSSAWQPLPLDRQVHLEAGEQLGAYELGTNAVAWDFIVNDHHRPNTFANPARYATSNLLHVVCPYAYYTTELRASFEALLGAPGTGPIAATGCGSVAVDVAGSIAGQWFLNPDATSGRGMLELSGGYGNPHPIAKNPDDSITFGNVGPSSQGFRVYHDAPSWRDPEDVTDSHCYALGGPTVSEGWLYYVIVSATEMKLFYSSSGECPEQPPTSGGRSYYR